MTISDFAIYFWLLPVTLQIVLPLVMFCGWIVFKLPALLFGSKPLIGEATPSYAR